MTGVAMWFALLVSIAYSPLSIFVPIFLQSLHRLRLLGRRLYGRRRLDGLDGVVDRRVRLVVTGGGTVTGRRAFRDGRGPCRCGVCR